MFAAIVILSLLAALILMVFVGGVINAPEGYQDKDGFHQGKVPDPTPVAIDEVFLPSLQLFGPPEGPVKPPPKPKASTSDTTTSGV
jgi:hypothetical protein